MRFCIDDTYYEVLIEKKNNKNLYIRITDDFKIKVTCPKLYTKLIINKILEENKISIKKMLDKKKKENINKIKEDNLLLGKSLNVLYKDVKKPLFKDNILIVKDDLMKDKWYKKKAIELFKIYLDEAYFVFDEDIPYPKLKVRLMKTRWGVCNKKDDSVTLNLELIKKDPVFLNYVIVHELSHFVHFDHSKAFWSTVEKYCPDYKNVRKKLKE
ncbi:MAG: M48 family metallopeptidase [Tenericutes bacterium]|nr:M48 family metallopeptidase [Mycoplasmatota bacterium]